MLSGNGVIPVSVSDYKLYAILYYLPALGIPYWASLDIGKHFYVHITQSESITEIHNYRRNTMTSFLLSLLPESISVPFLNP